jgi:hypothetical protein
MVNTNDRHAGYYYNLTGHVPDQSFKTLAKTVYHAMGGHDLTATDKDGRVYNLLEEGEPLRELFS